MGTRILFLAESFWQRRGEKSKKGFNLILLLFHFLSFFSFLRDDRGVGVQRRGTAPVCQHTGRRFLLRWQVCLWMNLIHLHVLGRRSEFTGFVATGERWAECSSGGFCSFYSVTCCDSEGNGGASMTTVSEYTESVVQLWNIKSWASVAAVFF